MYATCSAHDSDLQAYLNFEQPSKLTHAITLVLYSEGTVFESHPTYRSFLTQNLRGFPQPTQANPTYLKLRSGRFLPNSLQFIIHSLPYRLIKNRI
jgi:hypothetical protein